MYCPKCKHYMKSLEYKGITIDRCSHCYGMWFDKLEHVDMKLLSGAEVIDMGDVEVGREQNKKTEIYCPHCEILMLPVADKQQSHIHYERCPHCKGVYFDAGEFRDFKHLSLGEFFSSIFKKEAH